MNNFRNSWQIEGTETKTRHLWQNKLRDITKRTHKNTKRKNNLQLLDKLLKITLGSLLGHDLEHLLTDGTDVTSLGVTSRLLGLVGLLLGEGNGEKTKDVTISGTNIDVTLNKSLPLADKGADLVTGHVHTVEVSDNIVTLNILTDKLDLSEVLGLVTTVKLGERDLKDTTL